MPSDDSHDDANASSAATALRRLAELTEHLTAVLFWNTGSNFARRAGAEAHDQKEPKFDAETGSDALILTDNSGVREPKERKK